MPEIVFEDDYYLAVIKPAGLLVQGDRTGHPSLNDEVRQYLKNGFTGLIHRLDKHVSGIILFAKTSDAAAKISELIRDRDINKTYHAIVQGVFSEKTGRLEHYILKKDMKAFVYSLERTGTLKSTLTYQVEKEENKRSQLRISLETGRYNQIRAQFAYVRHPVIGDYKYMKRNDVMDSIALCAKELEFVHPYTDKKISLSAPFPANWEKFWTLD